MYMMLFSICLLIIEFIGNQTRNIFIQRSHYKHVILRTSMRIFYKKKCIFIPCHIARDLCLPQLQMVCVTSKSAIFIIKSRLHCRWLTKSVWKSIIQILFPNGAIFRNGIFSINLKRDDYWGALFLTKKESWRSVYKCRSWEPPFS